MNLLVVFYFWRYHIMFWDHVILYSTYQTLPLIRFCRMLRLSLQFLIRFHVFLQQTIGINPVSYILKLQNFCANDRIVANKNTKVQRDISFLLFYVTAELPDVVKKKGRLIRLCFTTPWEKYGLNLLLCSVTLFLVRF